MAADAKIDADRIRLAALGIQLSRLFVVFCCLKSLSPERVTTLDCAEQVHFQTTFSCISEKQSPQAKTPTLDP
jgi:hypothetical protein